MFGSAPGVADDVAAGLVAAEVAEGLAVAVVVAVAGAVVVVDEGIAVAVAVVPAVAVPDGVAVWAKAGTSRNRNIATAARPRAAVIPNVLFIGLTPCRCLVLLFSARRGATVGQQPDRPSHSHDACPHFP